MILDIIHKCTCTYNLQIHTISLNIDIIRLDGHVDFMKSILAFDVGQLTAADSKDRGQLTAALISACDEYVDHARHVLALCGDMIRAGVTDDERGMLLRVYVLDYRLVAAEHGMTGRVLDAEIRDIGHGVDRLRVDVQSRYSHASLVAVSAAYYRARFYVRAYEDLERGMQEGKEAFDKAIGELDSIYEHDYRQVTMVMQLIREDLTAWSEYSSRLEDL